MNLPTYAELLNRRILVVVPDRDHAAVNGSFFRNLLAPTLARIPVDERWYLETYADVSAALQEGRVASARDHYIRFGYFEHRMPRPLTVDEGWYLDQNPDVRKAVDTGAFRSGQRHFQLQGFQEGRRPRPGFMLCEQPAQPSAAASA